MTSFGARTTRKWLSLLIGCIFFLLIGFTPMQLFTEWGGIFHKMSKSLEHELINDPSVFWVLLGARKCRNITLSEIQRGSFVVFCPFSGFWMTEESLWPPGYNCQPFQALEEHVFVSKHPALSYCLCYSSWSSHFPGHWCWSEFEETRAPVCTVRV